MFLTFLEKRSPWEDLITASQYLRGPTRKSGKDFIREYSDRISGNSFKLKKR